MKKGLILIICIFSITIFWGCGSKINHEDKKLVSMVKEIEENEQKLNNFEITYDEYKNNTKGFMDVNSKNKDDEVIFAYEGKIYKGKDLIGVKKEKMLEMKKKLDKSVEENFGSIKFKNTKISKVYNDDNLKCKYVFVKENLQFTKMDESIAYKKYWIKKIDGKWKIIGMDKGIHSADRITSKDIEWNEKFNGENIEYIEKIDFVK